MTGGPDGSTTPLELELDEELLEELDDEELLLDELLLELDEFELEELLELLDVGVPLELPFPPHATNAAASTSVTLALVRDEILWALKSDNIKHIPAVM